MANLPPDAETPTPWRSDSLTNLRAPHVTHLWHVRYLHPTAGYPTLPAWDITVTLDETRDPHGVARMKMPLNTNTLSLTPFLGFTIEVMAGWRHTTGTPLDDEQVLFRGIISKVNPIIRRGGGSYVQVEATSPEPFWEHPLKTGTWNVSNTYTTLAQLITAMNAEPTRFYRTPIELLTIGTLPTPTAAQLAVYRDLEVVENGDSLNDFWHTCAESLGLWLRGDSRGRATQTPGVASTALVVSANYNATDTGEANGVTLSLDGLWDELDYEEGPSAADWANWVEFTARWRSASNWVTATRLYGSHTSDGGIMKVKKVTVSGKPPGGVLPADYGPALAYANAATRRTWQATLQCRAVWWLEPKQFVTFTPDPDPQHIGQISAITYQVDAGTMTITVRPGNYTNN